MEILSIIEGQIDQKYLLYTNLGALKTMSIYILCLLEVHEIPWQDISIPISFHVPHRLENYGGDRWHTAGTLPDGMNFDPVKCVET